MVVNTWSHKYINKLKNAPIIINSFAIGTIKCNFDADWCGFGTSANGDDAAKAGFKWQRKTGQQIKENNMEGPGQGLNFSS